MLTKEEYHSILQYLIVRSVKIGENFLIRIKDIDEIIKFFVEEEKDGSINN